MEGKGLGNNRGKGWGGKEMGRENG